MLKSVKFQKDSIERKDEAVILKYAVLAVFDAHRSKDDVIVKSLMI